MAKELVRKENNEMKFQASLKSVRIDDEGESVVSLNIPQSELQSVLVLAQATKKLLEVEVNAVEQENYN